MQGQVVVVDPFMGTGSGGVAAMAMGSYFIGADVDSDIVVIIFCPQQTQFPAFVRMHLLCCLGRGRVVDG